MMLLQQIRCGQIGDFRQRDGPLCGAFGIGAGDLIGALSDLELHIGAHALQKKKKQSCNYLFCKQFGKWLRHKLLTHPAKQN